MSSSLYTSWDSGSRWTASPLSELYRLGIRSSPLYDALDKVGKVPSWPSVKQGEVLVLHANAISGFGPIYVFMGIGYGFPVQFRGGRTCFPGRGFPVLEYLRANRMPQLGCRWLVFSAVF